MLYSNCLSRWRCSWWTHCTFLPASMCCWEESAGVLAGVLEAVRSATMWVRLGAMEWEPLEYTDGVNIRLVTIEQWGRTDGRRGGGRERGGGAVSSPQSVDQIARPLFTHSGCTLTIASRLSNWPPIKLYQSSAIDCTSCLSSVTLHRWVSRPCLGYYRSQLSQLRATAIIWNFHMIQSEHSSGFAVRLSSNRQNCAVLQCSESVVGRGSITVMPSHLRGVNLVMLADWNVNWEVNCCW